MIDLEQEQQEIEHLQSRLTLSKQTVEKEEKELKGAEQKLKDTQTAQEILQLLAQAVQQKAHQRISEVVSSCLSTVFEDEAYRFKIEFERKRGRTEARLRFTRRELEVDPLTAAGGGVVDVASFALRSACLILHRPRLSRVIVMDEPFKFLSAQYRERIRSMLEQLSKELDIQFIMVTHIEELETGKIYDL
jgi:DNA repair exonuclease SbcCD ATPase subunit